MLLKDYIPNLDKKYKELSFSGISFDSSKISKRNIFLLSKGISLMEINILMLLLRMVQQ